MCIKAILSHDKTWVGYNTTVPAVLYFSETALLSSYDTLCYQQAPSRLYDLKCVERYVKPNEPMKKHL